MSDIYEEIQQEIRRDDALKLWTKYQIPIYALAVLVLVGLGIWKYWQNRVLETEQAQSAAYAAALQLGADGKTADAMKALQALASGQGGAAILARMSSADETSAKDPVAGAAAFDALAGDQSLPPLFRNVARLRAAILHVDDKDPKAAEQRLQGLSSPAFPFHSMAQEQLAVLALTAKNYDEAGRWLDMIVADPESPAAVRARAQSLEGLVAGAQPAPKPTPISKPTPAAAASAASAPTASAPAASPPAVVVPGPAAPPPAPNVPAASSVAPAAAPAASPSSGAGKP